ncbi:MAG: hypothetical protein JWM68_3414 [Verrucomicrobiales bacterium]|nr:hypothetical protein [Verrucomicrobiales bacterium]
MVCRDFGSPMAKQLAITESSATKDGVKQVLWLLLISLGILYLCPSVFADGKVFTHAVAVPAKTPDQRAMLHFDKGVERLVIETSFVAEGTNFAWVVPFPSAPKIEAVSESFFSDLNLSFQPKLVYRPSKLWILYIFIGAVFSFVLFWTRSGKSAIGLLFVLLAISLFVLVAIPANVKTRGAGSSTTVNAVTVLQRQSVGIYDTVTLSSKDGSALLEWLNSNRFFTPSNALPVISSYAAQGWVFAAAILQRTNTASAHTKPHPLSFTFATEKAVYPLRLTGIENDKCAIELFVFGPDRAEADRFKVEYCGRPHIFKPESDDDWISLMGFDLSRPGEYRIINPEVRKITSPSLVTTKLVGTLSPRQMQSDAYLNWVPFQAALPTLYSNEVARDIGLSWFAFLVITGGLMIQLFAPRMSRPILLRSLLWTGLIASLAALLQFALLPKTEVRLVRNYNEAINNLRQLDGALDQLHIEHRGEAPLPFARFKAELDQFVKGGVKNPFTYKPLLEEKTPGNITLETNADGIDVMWYDLKAIPHRMITFEKAAKQDLR